LFDALPYRPDSTHVQLVLFMPTVCLVCEAAKVILRSNHIVSVATEVVERLGAANRTRHAHICGLWAPRERRECIQQLTDMHLLAAVLQCTCAAVLLPEH
jgi:hypothetical protein